LKVRNITYNEITREPIGRFPMIQISICDTSQNQTDHDLFPILAKINIKFKGR